MSVTDDELLLLSQFVHSGYFAPSVRFEEPTLRGLDLTDRCVPALLAVLQVGLFPGLAVLDLTDSEVQVVLCGGQLRYLKQQLAKETTEN